MPLFQYEKSCKGRRRYFRGNAELTLSKIFSDNVDNDIQSLCNTSKQRITEIFINEEKKLKIKTNIEIF